MLKIKKYFTKPNSSIRKVITQLNKSGRKCLIVSNNKNILLGTISDGDVRKAILSGNNLSTKINDTYNKHPIFLTKKNYTSEKAKKIFKKKHIDLIPILNNENQIIDIVFWDDNDSLKNLNKLNIPVVIMAGGFGKRLLPITRVIPKPLIPFENKTVIEKIIDNFFHNGSKNFNLIVNYKSKIIKAYFQDLKHTYKINFIEESKPLGTVGGVFKLQNKLNKDFILTNCDIISNIDYTDFYRFHKSNNNDMTIIASSKSLKVPYGVIEAKEDLLLSKITEKPELNFLINIGIYALKPSIIRYIPKNQYFDMPDLIKKLKDNNKTIGIYSIYEDQWFDVGQLTDYENIISSSNS